MPTLWRVMVGVCVFPVYFTVDLFAERFKVTLRLPNGGAQ